MKHTGSLRDAAGSAARASRPLAKIARTSLVDEVIAAIRAMLQEEGWNAGAKLPSEHQLTLQLGVGRSTVREALRVLGHLGLVQSRSGLGTFVTAGKLSVQRVEAAAASNRLVQLFEFRRMIEVAVAPLAAERRSSSEFTAIETAWQRCCEAARHGSTAAFTDLDYTFHLSIVEAAGNDFMVESYRSIEADFGTYVSMILELGPLERMTHFHDDLIDAIRRQDTSAAIQAVQQNFMDTDVRQRMIAPL